MCVRVLTSVCAPCVRVHAFGVLYVSCMLGARVQVQVDVCAN